MKKILLLIFSITTLFSFAQHQHSAWCGTPSLSPEEKAILRTQLENASLPKNGGFTCVPIKIHIVRLSNGTGGATMQDVMLDLSFLNEKFAPMELEFYVCGSEPLYLDDNNFYDFNIAQENNMVNGFGPEANNTINLFFVNSIGGSPGTGMVGYTYQPQNLVSTNRIVLDRNVISTGHTLVHEVGHWLSLMHTFDGTEQGNTHPNAENVARVVPQANCLTSGDDLCDTEADPGFNGTNVDLGCNYTGTATDQFGELYTPLLDNIMSYFPENCQNPYTLTPDQYARSSDGLAARLNPTLLNNPPGSSFPPAQYAMDCPPQALPAPTNFTATLNGASVDLTWIGNGTQVGYFIERSSTSATDGFVCYGGMGVVAGTTTFTDNGPLASNTTYYYRIKAANGDCDAYSNVESVTTGIIICEPQVSAQDNCNLGIDFGFPGITAHINRVRLNDGPTSLIDNSSGCDSQGYQDFTSIIAFVDEGETYQMIVNLTSPGFPSPSSQNIAMWVDWNDNGDFEMSEMMFQSTNPAAQHTFNFTIPTGVSPGAKVMRVRGRLVDDGNGIVEDACDIQIAGEAEDYTLSVQSSGPACEITNVVAPTMNQTPCASATNTFTQEIEITYANPPASGQIDVNGQLFPITSSPQVVTLTNLPANGNSVDVEVVFTDNTNCEFLLTNAFTAPANCAPVCEILSIVASGTQSACDPATDTYTQEVTVTYDNEPSSGQLSINGQTFAITSSPQTEVLTNLNANGNPVNVSVLFTANSSCALTENALFTAPASCAPVCEITNITAGTQSACDPANNTYTQDVTISYDNPPSSGQLNVNGQTFAITSSPQTVTLTNLNADGNDVDVSTLFTNNTSCSFTANALFTAPASCGTATCQISNITAGAQTPCDPATNTYTQEVVVTYSGAPTSGQLIVNGEFVNILGSPQTVILNNLAADGNQVDIAAVFTDDTGCFGQFTNVFTAPTACSSVQTCAVNNVVVGAVSNCDPVDNTYSQELTINYTAPPATGQMVVNGEFFPISGSPQTVVLDDLPADGNPVDVAVIFTDQTNCFGGFQNLFTAPNGCGGSSCSISSIVAGTQGPCNPVNNTFSQQVIVTYNNPPSSGQITINGSSFNITGSPQSFTLSNLQADNTSTSVAVSFTANPNCTFSVTDLFTAPSPCTTVCGITNFSAGNQTACDPLTNSYTQEIEVVYINPPNTGDLIVNGQAFPITGSPQTIILTGLLSDGNTVNVNASFSAVASCVGASNGLFTAPTACASIGTLRPLTVIMLPEGAGTLNVGNDIITTTPFIGNYPVGQLLNIQATTSNFNAPFVNWKLNTSPLLDYDANSFFAFTNQDTLWAYFVGAVGLDAVDAIFSDLKVYPTVTNNQINIEYTLRSGGEVAIDLFSLDGRLIRQLSNNESQPNVAYKESYNISEVATGVYFVRFLTDKGIATHKIIKTE